MINGHIVDVHPDYKHDVMVIWLKTKNKTIPITRSYHPSFFVFASSPHLQSLASKLTYHPLVKHLKFTTEKTTIGSNHKTKVLKVTPTRLSAFHTLAKQIDQWGRYHRYQLYNVDLRLSTRYLHEHHLFFNAAVRWDGRMFLLSDDQWAVDYELPNFSSKTFSLEQQKKHPVSSIQDPIKTLILDTVSFQEENEIDTILSMMHALKKNDPDILYTTRGDSTIFPVLYHRAKHHGILSKLCFGRNPSHYLGPMKQETSYMSYGRILHRPSFYTFQGRAHIDRAHSFFHMEGGLYGLLDLSRCSNISFQLLSRLGPGTAISQIQVNHATRKGYLIPYKKTRPEMWKTAAGLLQSDRGGLILEADMGLHEQVIEFDFASLYPTIMVNYNISPETLLCSCCSSERIVPQLGYHICIQKTGLLPMVLHPILQRRFLFKARSKNHQFDMQRYSQLQKTWKWVLIVCFGYTGYRNARYGRIECHESITAYSRDLLLQAVRLVEHAGYQVLHGIVDSLWVHAKNPSVTPVRLARLIGQQTGVRMELEGSYRWIVFLPSKGTGVGALNRYYGLFDNGRFKIRGVELRQHSTPPFFKEIQRQMLQVFQHAGTREAFEEHIPSAVMVLVDAARMLQNHQVDPYDLLFTTRISKPLSSYKVNTFATAALAQLERFSIHLQPGQSVRYLVKNQHATDDFERVCVQDLVTTETPYDIYFYIHYLAQCGETLLTPFSYTKEQIEHHLLNTVTLGGNTS